MAGLMDVVEGRISEPMYTPPGSGGVGVSKGFGGGGGGGAQAGLGQVQQGAGAIGAALGQISSALGGGGGGGMTQQPNFSMKKGGSVKKYTHGGKINLDACGVSTHQKSKKSSDW